MKKGILVALVLTIASVAAQAQLGIRAGANVSYVSGNSEVVSKQVSEVGLQGGLMYKIPVIDDWLSIRPELIYIQKGGAYNIEQLSIDARLGYVELPVLGVINFLGGNFNAHLGPQFSFLTNVVYTGSEEGGQNELFKDTDKGNYHSLDWGLVLGAGIELEVLMIELRYTFGFVAVEEGIEYNGQTYQPNSKNFNVQLMVGYFF